MSDIVAFIRARLDEDRADAEAADFGPWEVGPNFGGRDNRVYVRQVGDLSDSIGTCVIACQVPSGMRFRGNARHIARQDPARTLREVDAKRRLLFHAEHMAASVASIAGVADGGGVWMHILRLMTMPYSDHPDYDQSWSVTA